MAASARLRRPLPALALLAALGAGCAHPAGPLPIALGTPCARCGMPVDGRRFACEREVDGTFRVYDSIECLIADRSPARSPADPSGSGGGAVYLSDYDRGTLHAADSLWVVQGDFHSPMGGGYAAFLDRAAADDLARSTHGRVDRLAAYADSARGGR